MHNLIDLCINSIMLCNIWFFMHFFIYYFINSCINAQINAIELLLDFRWGFLDPSDRNWFFWNRSDPTAILIIYLPHTPIFHQSRVGPCRKTTTSWNRQKKNSKICWFCEGLTFYIHLAYHDLCVVRWPVKMTILNMTVFISIQKKNNILTTRK